MSTRLPLGLAGVENVHVHKATGKDDAVRMKSKDRVQTGDAITGLEREVQSLRARVTRRDDTINKLQGQVKSHASRSELETQVEEIAKRQEASKAKYQAELSKLKLTNDTLQKANEETKAKEVQVLAKVSDIRSKLALADAENSRLKKELASRPLPQAGPTVDEKLTWRKEKAALDVEIRGMKKDMDARSKKEEEMVNELTLLKGLKGESERLKYGWGVITERYAELHDSFEFGKKEWRLEKLSLESDLLDRQRATDDLDEALSAKQQECADLREQLEDVQTERDIYLAIAEQIQATRAEIRPVESTIVDDINPLSPLIEFSDVNHLFDLAIGHMDLISDNTSDLEPHIISLTTSILTLEQSLRETTSALTTLRTRHASMETDFAESRLEHASCGVTISQLRYDADQANQITAVRDEELEEVRVELRKMDERSSKQSDLLARANENEARSKFALESLEEEIVHLQNKYHEFAGYEEKYEELFERQALLEARETVAIEEAERLAMQNAELLGHTNGSQRIGYVDNVRREMVLCKHELASTRHLLNNANDRIRALEREISAYRTISPDLGLGQSRTRVVRRQPEGSHLTASSSAGSRHVSASGPGAARRFV